MRTQTGFVQSRLLIGLMLAMTTLAGCAEDAPCGVDTEGEPIAQCFWDSDNADEQLMFCPGDHFAADDGCQSCGCGAGGEVICTQSDCN